MHFESIASDKSGRLPGFEPCLARERTGRRSLGGRLTDKCRGGRAQSSLDWGSGDPLLTWLSRSPEKKTNTDRSRCGSFNWDHVAGHIRVIGLVYRINRNPVRVLLDSAPPAPRGAVAGKAFHTELIMDALGRLVDWCRREGESLQMQREMLQSGKFRIFKNEGSGQVDASSEIIERISANITELDSLLDECKVRPSDAQTS